MDGEEQQLLYEVNVEFVVLLEVLELVFRVFFGDFQNLFDVDVFNLFLEMKLKWWCQWFNLLCIVIQLVVEDGSRVYVVGIVYFSDDSKRDVVKIIWEVQFDVVVVEFC